MSLQYFVICDECGETIREKELGDVDELHFCCLPCAQDFFNDNTLKVYNS